MNLRSLFSGFLLLAAVTLLTAQDVSITFNVGTEFIEVADNGGIYIAGGEGFGDPGDNQLTDDDGDGTYSITLTRPAGFSSFYTFLNGNCPDYGCKEMIAGQSCSDPDNSDDRFLPAITSDIVVNTCFGECSETASCTAPPESTDVTFNVDMSSYPQPFTTAYVAGSFNGFSPDANPMSDDENDGVWTATIALPTGQNEFKFQLDRWNAQEFFPGSKSCTVINGDSTNRIIIVEGATMVLPTVCFNSCNGCNQEDQVSITFNVGTSNITVADGGLFIAGGGNFGDPGENQLTDDDGDGVYSITFFREAGFTSFYAFANGNCPDFSCKENITGQACANPDNSNDRFLAPVISNTIINTCYGICTDNTECGAPLERSEVTFTLNMNEYTEPFTTAYVAGSFNNWSADANPMSDDDGDGIYTATISINPGPFEFKYQLDMWTVEELFMGGESCTVTNGGLTNRTFTVVEATEVLPSFCFNSCNDCAVGTLDLAIYGINFELYPTVVNQELVLNLGQKTAQQSTVQIVTAEGKLVQTLKLIGEQRQQLNVSQLPAGVYFVRLQHRDAMGVRRFVKP